MTPNRAIGLIGGGALAIVALALLTMLNASNHHEQELRVLRQRQQAYKDETAQRYANESDQIEQAAQAAFDKKDCAGAVKAIERFASIARPRTKSLYEDAKRCSAEQEAKAAAAKAAADLAASKATKARSDKRFEECRSKLKLANKLDLLHDMSFDAGTPRVVVGPTFFTVDYSTKQGFAETANCFLTAGDQGRFMNFELLDWRTEKPVAKFSYGKLKLY